MGARHEDFYHSCSRKNLSAALQHGTLDMWVPCIPLYTKSLIIKGMSKSTLNTTKLQAALARHTEISEKKLRKRHPKAVSFFDKHGITPGKIRQHAAPIATTKPLAAAILFRLPLAHYVMPSPD